MRRYVASRGDEPVGLAPDLAGSIARPDLGALVDVPVAADLSAPPALAAVRVFAFADDRARADLSAADFTAPDSADERAPAVFAAPAFAGDRAADFADFALPDFAGDRTPADLAAPDFTDDFADADFADLTDFAAPGFADDRAAADLAAVDVPGLRCCGAALRLAVAGAFAVSAVVLFWADLRVLVDPARLVGVRGVAGLARVFEADLGATGRSYPASSAGTRTASPSAARSVNASRTALACQSLLKYT